MALEQIITKISASKKKHKDKLLIIRRIISNKMKTKHISAFQCPLISQFDNISCKKRWIWRDIGHF